MKCEAAFRFLLEKKSSDVGVPSGELRIKVLTED
jgi:hypothetical protein